MVSMKHNLQDCLELRWRRICPVVGKLKCANVKAQRRWHSILNGPSVWRHFQGCVLLITSAFLTQTRHDSRPGRLWNPRYIQLWLFLHVSVLYSTIKMWAQTLSALKCHNGQNRWWTKANIPGAEDLSRTVCGRAYRPVQMGKPHNPLDQPRDSWVVAQECLCVLFVWSLGLARGSCTP